MIEASTQKFYGNHRGQVRVIDPVNQKMIRIRVYPMFREIKDEHLPLAAPATPLFTGAMPGAGCICIPEVDSWVWVFFENGDPNQPVYFASADSGVTALPTAATANYPKTRGFVSASGAYVLFNDELKTVKISNPAGTASILMEDSGAITVVGTDVTVNGTNVVIAGSTKVDIN